jgi:hypothetical protein
LNDIFPGSDLIEDVVSEDLVVLDDTSDLEFLDAVGHFQLLHFLAPGEPVDYQRQDILGEGVQIGLSVVDLHVEHEDGFGDGLLFLLGGDDVGLGLGHGLGLSFGLIIAEEIDFVLILDRGSGSGGNGGGGGLLNPALEDERLEGGYEEVPIVQVGGGGKVGEF